MAATRRLTVVQLLPALDSGGVERGTLEVAEALVRAGHRSLVVSAGGRLVQGLEQAGSEHIELPVGRKSPASLLLVSRLRGLFTALDADVVHARSRLPAWLTWLAWRGMPPVRRPRFVTTVHGYYRPGRYSSVMTRGERVIAVSGCIREYVLTNYPAVEPRRLRLIERGVDPSAFPHGYRPTANWLSRWQTENPRLSGRRLVCLPGRLSRRKGHEHLLLLLAHLRALGMPVHGVVMGDVGGRGSRYADELRSAAARAGIGDALTFLGQRCDVREVYAVCDVVLSLSSKPESFGRTALEALSLGVPVVGYDHGGVGEVLGRLFAQGLVPPGDVDSLVRKVADLLLHPSQVPPVEHYRLSSMLAATLDLYAEVCST